MYLRTFVFQLFNCSYTDLDIAKIRNNNNDKPSPSGKKSKKLYFANDDDLVDLDEDEL